MSSSKLPSDDPFLKASRQFTLRFSGEEYEKVKKIAHAETRSVSNLLRHLCHMKIAEYESLHGEIDICEKDLIL